jgi:hypothetical protein
MDEHLAASHRGLGKRRFLKNRQWSGQIIYLTAFQPTVGVATYQDVTLPADEPVIGDPPRILRNIALPNIKKS